MTLGVKRSRDLRPARRLIETRVAVAAQALVAAWTGVRQRAARQ